MIVEDVKKEKKSVGFNVATEKYDDLLEGRRARSDQGDPLGAAERGVGGRACCSRPRRWSARSPRRRSPAPMPQGGGGGGGYDDMY